MTTPARSATAALSSQARLALARAASMAERDFVPSTQGDAASSARDVLAELAAAVTLIGKLTQRCAPRGVHVHVLAHELADALASESEVDRRPATGGEGARA